MPNRTIYVSEKDAGIFAAAQQKAGSSLSGVIADSLRSYLEPTLNSESDFVHVQVKLDSATSRTVRFEGKKLLGTFDKQANMFYMIYATPKSSFAVVTCTLPDLSALKMTLTEWSAQVLSWLDHNFDSHTYNYRLQVHPSLDALHSHLPEFVSKRLARRLDELANPVEDLNI